MQLLNNGSHNTKSFLQRPLYPRSCTCYQHESYLVLAFQHLVVPFLPGLTGSQWIWPQLAFLPAASQGSQALRLRPLPGECTPQLEARICSLQVLSRGLPLLSIKGKLEYFLPSAGNHVSGWDFPAGILTVLPDKKLI